jgi:hypothetical protein
MHDGDPINWSPERQVETHVKRKSRSVGSDRIILDPDSGGGHHRKRVTGIPVNYDVYADER